MAGVHRRAVEKGKVFITIVIYCVTTALGEVVIMNTLQDIMLRSFDFLSFKPSIILATLLKGPELKVDKHHFSGFGVRYNKKKQSNLQNHTLSCQFIRQVVGEAVQLLIFQ